MALNIKNSDAERLAREVASATGESLTTAVTVALRERLDRVQRTPDDKVERLRRLNEVSTAFAADWASDGRTSAELVEELYDPHTGLPV